MSFEEEFDRIVRQKAEQADFPFDGKNWDKAAAMLDGQKAVTGLPIWKKMIVPAVLGIAAITALVVMLPIEDNQQTAISKAQNNNVIESKSENNNLPTTVSASRSTAQNNTEVFTASNPQKTSDNISAPALSAPVNQNTAPAAIQKEYKQTTKQAAAVGSENSNNVRTPKPTSSTAKVIHTAINNQVDSDAAVPVPPIDNSDHTVVDNVINTRDAEPEHEVEPPVAAVSNENLGNAEVLYAEAEISNAKQTNNTSLGETSEIKENLSNLWLPAKSLLLEMPQDNLSVDTKIEVLPLYLQDDYVKKALTYYLSAVGGLHYAFGWETAVGIDGRGYNYFGGLECGKFITKNLSIGTGLHYFTFTNIYQPYFESFGKGYGFGYTQRYSGVTTDRVNYLSVPLFINYTSPDGFSMGAGITGNYLVSVHNRIDTYGVSDGIKGPVKSEGNDMIYQGTKVFGMMANVRIGYTVFNRMNVFADLQYGLNDLFDAQTKKQTAEKITGVRFGLNYILIKK